MNQAKKCRTCGKIIRNHNKSGLCYSCDMEDRRVKLKKESPIRKVLLAFEENIFRMY